MEMVKAIPQECISELIMNTSAEERTTVHKQDATGETAHDLATVHEQVSVQKLPEVQAALIDGTLDDRSARFEMLLDTELSHY